MVLAHGSGTLLHPKPGRARLLPAPSSTIGDVAVSPNSTVNCYNRLTFTEQLLKVFMLKSSFVSIVVIP